MEAQDLTRKAEELKQSTNSLDDKAKEAENNLKSNFVDNLW